MSKTVVFGPGGYRYIPAVFQYSSGVAAEEGYEIERARFAKPLPMAEAVIGITAWAKPEPSRKSPVATPKRFNAAVSTTASTPVTTGKRPIASTVPGTA